MKHNREFEIAWQGLQPGLHSFVYDLDNRFMQEHLTQEEGFKDWNARVTLNFDKKSDFFMLHFDVDGKVTVPCDRCGDDFEMRLWDEFDLVIKLTGDDAEKIEDEDDVVFIPRSETVFDISGWLYEYIMLSIPLQKVHPDKEDGTPGCNPQALKLLNKLSEPEDKVKNNIWKGLEVLKEEKNNEEETNNKRKSK